MSKQCLNPCWGTRAFRFHEEDIMRMMSVMDKKHLMTRKTVMLAMMAVIFLSGGSLCPKAAEISNFDRYVTAVDDLAIPEGTRITALGEATHGNREFQQLKREVFEILVRKNGIRALVIEGDFGGCTVIDEYIQGGAGDDREMTKLLGYRLYRTDDMQELIRWMRNYNQTASEEEKVRLYGMDIQNCTCNIRILKEFYERVAPDQAANVSDQLDDLFGMEEDGYDKARIDEIITFMNALSADLESHNETYIGASNRDHYFRACLAVEALDRYINYREKEDFSHRYRDGSMKELVDRILAFEEREHGSELMIACHNGHMTKNQSSRFTFLGKDLYEELGSAYFAIGTDFYITSCNLPGNDGRIIKEFCSDDPLAFNMKDSSLDKGLLVFSEVDKGSTLYPYISESIPTGSLGEAYTPLMLLMKNQYQIYFAPEEMYDAMILYYQTTPTQIWEE